jgi:YbaB/EbfC DNA-binding family
MQIAVAVSLCGALQSSWLVPYSCGIEARTVAPANGKHAKNSQAKILDACHTFKARIPFECNVHKPACGSADTWSDTCVMCRTEFDGYDEEETVKIVFLGNQSPVKCELTQAAMDCGQEELEKRIQEAMTDAHAKCANTLHAYQIHAVSCNLISAWARGANVATYQLSHETVGRRRGHISEVVVSSSSGMCHLASVTNPHQPFTVS